MTIDEIRTRFPHPMTPTGRGNLADPREYCVGGALCLSQGRAGRFPSTAYLTRVLRSLNPCLRGSVAERFAAAIIDYNDAGNFEAAWQAAGEALAAGQPQKG